MPTSVMAHTLRAQAGTMTASARGTTVTTTLASSACQTSPSTSYFGGSEKLTLKPPLRRVCTYGDNTWLPFSAI